MALHGAKQDFMVLQALGPKDRISITNWAKPQPYRTKTTANVEVSQTSHDDIHGDRCETCLSSN